MAGSRTVAVERKTLTAINTTVDAMGTNWIIFCSVSREGRGCVFCSQEQLWGFSKWQNIFIKSSEDNAFWGLCSEHRAHVLRTRLNCRVVEALLAVYDTLFPRQEHSQLVFVTAHELD